MKHTSTHRGSLRSIRGCTLALCAAGVLGFTSSSEALQLTFNNQTGLPDSEVYIYFEDALTATFWGNSNTVTQGQSYSLETIGSGGIDLTSITGGRIFAMVGAPFPETTTVPQFINAPAGPGLNGNNSYNNTHQLLGELTTGSTGVANLSNIDWVAIPAIMKTFNSGGTQLGQIGYTSNTFSSATMNQRLTALTNGGATFTSIPNLAGNPPTAYSQTGTPSIVPQSPASGSDVRIIGSSQYQYLASQNLSNYPSFQGYINSINTNNPTPSQANPIAKLKGQFFVPGSPVYEAYVTGLTLPGSGDPSYSLGQVTITGTTTTGPGGAAEPFTIQIPYESLTNATIYGGTTGSPTNPDPNNQAGVGYNLSVNGGAFVPTDGGVNTIYTAAVRDFLAGLNYGFIDSTVANPNDPGNTYKESFSYLWGTTNLLTGAMNPEEPLFYGQLQTSPFYNQWAEVIWELSGGSVYGFGYDDTFNIVQLGLGGDVSKLEITLLPDIFSSAVPEPSVTMLAGAGIAALAFGVRRKRKG